MSFGYAALQANSFIFIRIGFEGKTFTFAFQSCLGITKVYIKHVDTNFMIWHLHWRKILSVFLLEAFVYGWPLSIIVKLISTSMTIRLLLLRAWYFKMLRTRWNSHGVICHQLFFLLNCFRYEHRPGKS